MKIKDGYVVRDIVDTKVVVPVGGSVIDFKGLMTLNESGAFIWNTLLSDRSYDEVLAALLDEYEVNRGEAGADLDVFLQKIRDLGVLDE